MLFENLHVTRTVVHEVFQRGEDRALRTPVFADSLETLSAEAMMAFRSRFRKSLSTFPRQVHPVTLHFFGASPERLEVDRR